MFEPSSLSGWREETYDVRGPDRSAEPLFKLERSATPILGIRSYGVNINGFVRDGDGKVEAIWLQRRAADKQTWPGKLDHLVGGGLEPYALVDSPCSIHSEMIV